MKQTPLEEDLINMAESEITKITQSLTYKTRKILKNMK
jgi:hypothetical protein